MNSPHFEIISSRMDKNGNRYWAVRVYVAGQQTRIGTICANNVASALRHHFGDWDSVRTGCTQSEIELPIREFDRLVKGVPHFGCTGEEIAANLFPVS